MNQAICQRIGLWKRLLTLAAALLPLLIAGAAYAPNARAAHKIFPIQIPTQTPIQTIVTAPDELLYDLSAAATTAPSHHLARIVRMEVTAYCPCSKCCGPSARGITASGRSVAYNCGLFAAADTDRYPLGTRLTIPGYAEGQAVEVIDRGSAIKGNHIDIFFPRHEQAQAWGRKWLAVTVSD